MHAIAEDDLFNNQCELTEKANDPLLPAQYQ